MKALIIGFGKMGMLHAATLNSLDAVTEVILCDASALVREAVRAFSPGRKVYADYKEALERETIDLAVIATPNHVHFPVLCDLLKKKIHTFIEKPFVADFTEAQAAYDLFRRNGAPDTKIMIGYCLRFVPTYGIVKKMILEGALGKISDFEVQMYSSDVLEPQKGWRFEKSRKGSGVLLDLGSHVIDLTRFLFGMPEKVSGVTESRVSKGIEDYFKAHFFYQGFSGTVEASWSVPNIRKPTPVVSVRGENGTLTVTNDEVVTDFKKAAAGRASGRLETDIIALSRQVPFDLAGPYYTEQWLEFLEAITRKIHCQNNIMESLQDHELVDLIRGSAGVEKPVSGGRNP
jgi:predicted dehydrogenase